AVGQGDRVVCIVDGVGRALRVGQRGGAGAHHHEGLLLFGRHGRHGQGGGGIGAADQHVEMLLVEPFAGAGRGDVGLVLVVGGQQFDFLPVDLAPHVGDRHADGIGACITVDVGVYAGHVCDEADADHVVGNPRGLGG